MNCTRTFISVLLIGSAFVTGGQGAAEEAKPRVLIIGDSISQGYTGHVAGLLKERAVVVRNPDNAGATINALAKPSGIPPNWPQNALTDAAGQVPDPRTFDTYLDYYLAHGPFDVIHFNWGLHDLKQQGRAVPQDQYIANLDKIVSRMQELAPKAKLIFGTTTPVPPVNRENRRPEMVVEYNKAAVELMRKKGVAVDDLYAAILPHVAEYGLKDNVHFGGDGYRFLGEQVAAAILKAIDPNAKPAWLEGKKPPATAAPSATPTVPTPAQAGSSAAAGTAPKPSEDAAAMAAQLVTVQYSNEIPCEWDWLRLGGFLQNNGNLEQRGNIITTLPEELQGLCFLRVPHRLPPNTSISFTFHAPTTVYFMCFISSKHDGGFGKVMEGLDGWTELKERLEYDQKAMRIFRRDFESGTYIIPASKEPYQGKGGVTSLAIKPRA